MSKYTKENFFSLEAKKAFIEREAKLRASDKWPLYHWYTDEDFCELYRMALDLKTENESLRCFIANEIEVCEAWIPLADETEAGNHRNFIARAKQELEGGTMQCMNCGCTDNDCSPDRTVSSQRTAWDL